MELWGYLGSITRPREYGAGRKVTFARNLWNSFELRRAFLQLRSLCEVKVEGASASEGAVSRGWRTRDYLK